MVDHQDAIGSLGVSGEVCGFAPDIVMLGRYS
jgi:hypothetical protein